MRRKYAAFYMGLFVCAGTRREIETKVSNERRNAEFPRRWRIAKRTKKGWSYDDEE